VTEKRTLVVGIGEVGGPLAQVLEAGGHPVLRHDLEPLSFEEPIGIMHICFPFRDRKSFCETVAEYARRFNPELIIINSTVLPGTTRMVERITKRKACYSPVRGKHVEMAAALRNYRKFVAGTDPAAVERAEAHFLSAGLKTERMTSPEALELAKLAETTYFGVLIAFAQELNRYAEGVQVEYAELTNFFKEISFLPRTSYYPGFIGGHCVIPNINLLLQMADSPLLKAVLTSNERRAEELALFRPDTSEHNRAGN
jgi:UDP-N-acetyl-D-mannosaminuronate dehydrogenase